MEAGFWHNRWENNLTGFHLGEVNPHLMANWSVLNMPAESRILVPLCGKSLDLIWLAEQGHKVVGVELSHLAAEAFFSENELSVERQQAGELELFVSENISIFSGDIFNLTADILGKVDAVYDRASLIALPAAMWNDYAAKILELAPTSSKLLITLEYDQTEMKGPPFSVSEDEIRDLYQSKYQIKQLSVQDVLDSNGKFREKGLNYLNECVYQMDALG